MKKVLYEKGKEAFGQIAKHNFLYGNVSWKTYFMISPFHYICYRILNSIQALFRNNIIRLKSLDFFVAVNIYVIEKNLGAWPKGPNLIINKMDNIQHMWDEVVFLQKILRRVKWKIHQSK